MHNKKFYHFLFFLILSFLPFSILGQKNVILDVKIRGLKKTKSSAIQKVIKVDKNQPLDSLALDKDMIRLKRLPAISHAYYQVFHSDKNTYNVFIYLEENLTLIPEFNIWTTTNQQTAYKIGLYDHNFLGRNIAFGAFYQNNGFNSYGVNFRAPTLFSGRLGMALNHQNWSSEEPLYFGHQTANYKYQNVSYEALGLYQHNFKNNFQFGINYFKERYEYLSGDTSANIPLKLDVNKWLLKVIYTYDNLDYFYQYMDGFKSEFYGQYVMSENKLQDNFLIAWNDFFYYKRIGIKGNWANRLRVGLASNNESPFAPFALDNNVNLRGVGILVDRGTGSIVWNTEYRHTLYENNWFVAQSNVFADVGTWRKPGGNLSDFTDKNNIKIYSGIGMRFINKKIFNAVFRIDYAFGVHHNPGESTGGLVFGIGQYF